MASIRRLAQLSTRALRRPKHLYAVRCLATVQTGRKQVPEVFFDGTPPSFQIGGLGYHKKPDERTLKLGKTLRTLQPLLPTLLQSPLPTAILSPQITLHLFPSTHPHLPTVSGRVAYVAALWTSPLAWGRVPIVGNVKLEILSERMIRKSNHDSPLHYSSDSAAYRGEQLVVRWRTIGKSKSGYRLPPTFTSNQPSAELFKGTDMDIENEAKVSAAMKKDAGEDEFTGLFIFEFDEEGRIVSHTIEHVQEGGNWEKGVGAKVVGLTDWLLGGLKPQGGGEMCPAMCTDGARSRGD